MATTDTNTITDTDGETVGTGDSPEMTDREAQSTAEERPMTDEPTTTLEDGTVVFGDQLGGELPTAHRTNHIPHDESTTHEHETFRAHLRISMKKERERLGQPEPTPEEVEEEYKRMVAGSTQRRKSLNKTMREILPESACPDAKAVDDDIEVAAVLRLPEILWAWTMLLVGRDSGPKNHRPWRRIVASCVLCMGFSDRFPDVRKIVTSFCKRDYSHAFTFLWPGEPPNYPDEPLPGEKPKPWDLSACYKRLHWVLREHLTPGIWAAINRDMIREIAGAHHFDDKRGGRFANIPDALTYLLVDATFVEANISQRKPLDEEEARVMRNSDGQKKRVPIRARCGYLIYRVGNFISKRCHGYKWVQISSLKLGGLTLIGGLFPANVSERDATLVLLDQLFKLFPELKQQREIYLIGDALYDNEYEFAYTLLFKYGIHGVFPRHGSLAQATPHVETGGVPACTRERCGGIQCRRKDARRFPTPLYRITHGLAPAGEWVLHPNHEALPVDEQIWDDAEIRWACPSCGEIYKTRFAENPRLYTYLPHGGTSELAMLRISLLCYRNVIESAFSSMKGMGFAGTRLHRAKWADDIEMEHLAWMAATSMTARRLVHANGTYARVWRDAQALELLKSAMPTDVYNPYTEDEWTQAERELIASARAPEGWEEIDLAIDYASLPLRPDDQ
jgi:hypothetical protein